MPFTYRLVKGAPLSWAEYDLNLTEIEVKWLEIVTISGNALAAANFAGQWNALTGPLDTPAATYWSGKFWLLLEDVADVTAYEPGVDPEWVELVVGNVQGPASSTDGHAVLFDGATGRLIKSLGAAPVAKSGDTMTGNLGVGVSPAARLHVQRGTSPTQPSWTSADVVIAGNSTGESAFYQAFSDAAGGLVFSTPTQRARSLLLWSEPTGNMLITNGAVGDIVMSTNGGEAVRIDSSKNLLVTGSGGLGYGVGSGGTVTQATSKTTAVALNKPSGKITMSGAALAGGATVLFSCANSTVTARDIVVAHHTNEVGTADSYKVDAIYGADGAFRVRVINTSGGSLAEAIVINFVVLKVAAS